MELTAAQSAEPPTSNRRPFLILASAVFTLAASVMGVWTYNQQTLQKPLDKVLRDDPRNKVVNAAARFDGWVDFDTVVFEITTVSGESSQLDIFRVFLHFARELRQRRYQKVILAAYGQKKFVISGEYFQKLGSEFDTQNPMYTIRTFAHHVRTPDGESPFPEVHGGLFGVLKVEMEQFNELNRRWYLDDFAKRQK